MEACFDFMTRAKNARNAVLHYKLIAFRRDHDQGMHNFLNGKKDRAKTNRNVGFICRKEGVN